ncbi:hypothetical protein JTE90_010030 [Oedothorax gibbosus]|uniref:SCP domain-containing protein n=1 Tax=Oedothorax gibbosus TaxID=931172 RepID=A0AAV6V485_9ARAC|nr:hypothetical protein JTE90_010030 [Oedothorax gibbosus]
MHIFKKVLLVHISKGIATKAKMQFLAFTAILVGVLHWSYSCQIYDRGVSAADKKVILQTHNELRAKIANGKERGFPTAANMLEMEWDDNLANQAQAWADQCTYAHNKPIDRDGGPAGQNMAGSSGSNTKPEWKEMIESFYSEVKLYNPNNIHKYAWDEKTGHFSQVIWAKTSRIGCGYVRYVGDQYDYDFLYVCNYAPAANWDGEPVYEVGRPCSKCGGCGSIQGLCEAN